MAQQRLNVHGVEIALQELLPVALKLEEHYAITELRVAGYDTTANARRRVVQPERHIKVGAHRHRHHRLDVAPTFAQVGRFKAIGNVVSFFPKLNLNLQR